MSLYKPANIPANPSAQLQVALEWVDVMGKWDIDGLSSILAEDYKHYILPKTSALAMPKDHTDSRSEFFEIIRHLAVLIKELNFTVHEITECPGKVILHTTSNGISTTGHPYTNEYIFSLYFKQRADGQHEISAVKEFTDSSYVLEFLGAEKERLAEAAK